MQKRYYSIYQPNEKDDITASSKNQHHLKKDFHIFTLEIHR